MTKEIACCPWCWPIRAHPRTNSEIYPPKPHGLRVGLLQTKTGAIHSYSPLHLCSHLAPTPVWPGTWNTTNILPRKCGSTPEPQLRDWEFCFCKERPILPNTCLHQGPIPHSSAWSLVTCSRNSSAMSLLTCSQCICPNSPKFLSLSMLLFF